MILKLNLVALLAASVMVTSCNKIEDEAYTVEATDEMAQQLGDTMVSIDESGGSANGSITQINTTGYEKSFARLSGGQPYSISDLFISKSFAADCSSVTYGACAGGTLTRDFSAGCTVAGAGVLTGNVKLTYTGTGTGTCTIPANTDYVSRVPNYVIKGLRGATFEVKAVTTGQRITRVGVSAFTVANTGGITRKFTTASGKVVLDNTTTISSPVGIAGSARNGRAISGGTIVILDNLTAVSCSLSPNLVQWGTGCNCPTSGSWSGACSDTETLTVAFGSTCGVTTVTKGSTVKTVTMDRCQP